jgi:probable phosphoglycerate mutase
MSINVYSDGSHSCGGKQTKSAVVIYNGQEIIDTMTSIGNAGWSDVAEYRAILLGLKRLLDLGYQHESIQWYNDSEFVMNQMQGTWKIRFGKAYTELALEAKQLLKQFSNITFTWIPREENQEADALSKL